MATTYSCDLCGRKTGKLEELRIIRLRVHDTFKREFYVLPSFQLDACEMCCVGVLVVDRRDCGCPS